MLEFKPQGENIAKSKTTKNGILYFVKILIDPHKKTINVEKNKDIANRILLIPKLKVSNKLNAKPLASPKKYPCALTNILLLSPCVKAYPGIIRYSHSPKETFETHKYGFVKTRNNSIAKITATQLVKI
jgi:hypothetical protein